VQTLFIHLFIKKQSTDASKKSYRTERIKRNRFVDSQTSSQIKIEKKTK